MGTKILLQAVLMMHSWLSLIVQEFVNGVHIMEVLEAMPVGVHLAMQMEIFISLVKLQAQQGLP